MVNNSNDINMNFESQIDSIVQRFDFKSVAAYVEVMNKAPFKKGIPYNMGTPEQIKSLAKSMLEDVAKMKDDSILVKNGLEAEKIDMFLELRFVPLRINTLDLLHG
jgi:hypothetical protein